MAALTSVTLGFLYTCSWILAVSADPEELSARPGEDVTLQCQGPKHISIALLKWIRPDLESDWYVFFFRDNRPYERYQHQSYQGRVSLIDPRLKHGNASVLLKNVSISDTGTYHCHVSVRISKGFREENTEEITDKVILKVTAGQAGDGGNLLLVVILPVIALLVIVIVIVSLILCKYKKHVKKSSERPAADEAAEKKKLSPEPVPQ